ncbi:hypothetical protein LCGC14_2305920, partial [marine sediment metagenome]
FPPQRDGYGPRKYNINPETFGSAQKEISVDIIAFRDFQKNSLVNILVYQDSSIPGLVIENGALIFKETGAGSDYVGLIAPASVTTSVIYTLPPADGSSGDHLRTNGSGVLTWQTPAVGGGGWTDDGTDVRLTTVTDDVGIGISTPDTKLHVMETSAGAVSAANNTVLTLEDNTIGYLNILAPTEGGIAFGDVADNDVGRIRYVHATNTLRFDVDGSEALVMDDAQKLLIGVAASANSGQVQIGTFTVPLHMTNNTALEVYLEAGASSFASIFFGDSADTQEMEFGYDNLTDVGYLYIGVQQIFDFQTTAMAAYVYLNLRENSLYNLRDETGDPTHANKFLEYILLSLEWK